MKKKKLIMSEHPDESQGTGQASMNSGLFNQACPDPVQIPVEKLAGFSPRRRSLTIVPELASLLFKDSELSSAERLPGTPDAEPGLQSLLHGFLGQGCPAIAGRPVQP